MSKKSEITKNHHGHHSHHDHHEGHDHTIYEEFICHLPYAIFSVALALTVISFIALPGQATKELSCKSDILFHSFHFMHIVFAATGTMATFLRFSKNYLLALLVGTISPSIFCLLSDAVLPYLGGQMFGVHMHWHACFATELHNVLPFLIVGVINGIVLSKHPESRQSLYSLFSHFVHILVSSLASTFYLVSHGFTNWYSNIGFVFLFLVVAVVVPCTLSDVIVPMMLAKGSAKRKG